MKILQKLISIINVLYVENKRDFFLKKLIYKVTLIIIILGTIFRTISKIF